MSKKATARDDPSSFSRCLPTPVRRLDVRTAGAELWLKDDGLSGIPYGGNKVRKLEPLLQRALARRKHRVVTFGAVGSHHVLATTLFARELGLETLAMLTPQLSTAHAEDTFRCAIGAGLHAVPITSLKQALRVMPRLNRGDYLIGPGGMGGLGASGYFDAARELAHQIAERQLPAPDWIVVAAGSGSTAAGLLAGLFDAGIEARLLAVQVAPNPAIRPMVLGQAASVARLRRFRISLTRLAARIAFDRTQVGGGYGHPTKHAARAMAMAREAGLALDQTYTGKAFAAALVLAARLGNSSRVLFWNTLSAVPLDPLLASAPEVRDLPPELSGLFLPALVRH